MKNDSFLAPDRVQLHWGMGRKARHQTQSFWIVRFRFSLRIRFLRHLALMIKLGEGLVVSLYIGVLIYR